MELLEKITWYSNCCFISDLKYSYLWKIGIQRVIASENIENYSIEEWKETLEYLLGDSVSILKYEDVIQEVLKW